MTNVQSLQQTIDGISSEIDAKMKLIEDANEKALAKKEENIEKLVADIETQKKKLDDFIQQAEAENLMNKDIPTSNAIEDLTKLDKEYKKTMGKIEVLRGYEEVLGCQPIEIPQIAEYDKRFKKRDLLWKSRDYFGQKKDEWYTQDFLKQDAEAIVKEVMGYVR